MKDDGLQYENPLSEDLKEASPPPDYESLAAPDLDTKEDLGTFGNEGASMGAQGDTTL